MDEQEIKNNPDAVENFGAVDNQPYDESQIQVLEGLEAVRKRPWHVYWLHRPPGPASPGLRNCGQLYRRGAAGYCTHIEVEILPGDVISVRDNGRGIPVGIQEKVGLPP